MGRTRHPEQLPPIEGCVCPRGYGPDGFEPELIEGQGSLASTDQQQEPPLWLEIHAEKNIAPVRHVLGKSTNRHSRNPHRLPRTGGELRQRFAKGEVYLGCPSRQEASRDPRPRVLLLEHQGCAHDGRRQSRRRPSVPARHNDQLRTDTTVDSDRRCERGHEGEGNANVRPPLTTVDPSHRKEVMVQRSLGEYPSLEASTCTEEERPDVRALPYELVRECQSRIEMAPGSASGEDHDRPRMHAPSFPREGASRSPARYS